MLFCESQNGVADCKGKDMWAGKCCCASTRVFPASSAGAELALRTDTERAAVAGEKEPISGRNSRASPFSPSFPCGRQGRGVGWGLGYRRMRELSYRRGRKHERARVHFVFPGPTGVGAGASRSARRPGNKQDGRLQSERTAAGDGREGARKPSAQAPAAVAGEPGQSEPRPF